ncbi:MAG: type II toxin-antitoxin system Phd/YefM family antitoxin [Alphaproteobacteria bacterium]|nr:type II toxin-antitoxin system Phd/YefM family antitoxin [Alphaproteobacteria bacterium]
MDERVWQLQDAKNKLSELVERAAEGEPQVVTKRGKRAAVLVSAAEYARLKGGSTAGVPTDFVQHLLSAPKGAFVLPRRAKTKLRPLDIG